MDIVENSWVAAQPLISACHLSPVDHTSRVGLLVGARPTGRWGKSFAGVEDVLESAGNAHSAAEAAAAESWEEMALMEERKTVGPNLSRQSIDWQNNCGR